MGDKVLMSQAEFARHMEWSRQYVNKLKRTGRLVLDGGQIDVLETKAILKESADPARQLGEAEAAPAAAVLDLGPPAAAPGGFQSHRSDREKYAAKLAQLEYEERIGTVVAKASVEDAFFELGRMLREGLDRRRVELAETLAGLSGMDAIETAIEDADRALLKRITDDVGKRIEPVADAAA
jgi:hypothetical protein